MNLAQRLKALIDRDGWKVAALERVAGLEPDTVRNILRGNTREPGASTLYALARAMNLTIEELLGEPPLGSNPPSRNTLPILFKTGAGVWVESDDYSQDGFGELEGTPIAAYSRFRQWYELLEGDSMNKIFPDGSYLHVVDAVDMGYDPRDGDIVIVERCRDGGFLRERSVKQVELRRGRIELWPRSTNERWQKPILINEHPEDDTVTVRIVGKVLRGVVADKEAA